MKAHRVLLIAAAILLPAASALQAHHDLGVQYDPKKSITLTGTIKTVKWSNPHVLLHLDGKAGISPDAMDWEIELASPNLLALSGLKISSLRPGDHLTVNAYPARDGSNFAYARKVTRDTH